MSGFFIETQAITNRSRWKLTVTDSQNASNLGEKKTTGAFQYSHNGLEQRIPYANPIDTGVVQFGIWIEDATDEAEILDAILNGTDRQFKAKLQTRRVTNPSFNDEWEGYIVPDLTQYQRDSYPFRATFTAKDYHEISDEDYPAGTETDYVNSTGYKTVATAIAEILGGLNLGSFIRTATKLTSDGLLDPADDYLNQTWINATMLKEMRQEGDSNPISNRQALSILLRNNNLILRQSGGAHWLLNLVALNGVIFQSAVYDFTGQQTSIGNVFLLANPNILSRSTVGGAPAIKEAKLTYAHRGQLDRLSFSEPFRVIQPDDFVEKTQFFDSNGTQTIKYSGSITADIPDTTDIVANPRAEIQIQVGEFYWNGAEWTTENSTVTVPSTKQPIQPTPGTDTYTTDNFMVKTTATPAVLQNNFLTVRSFGYISTDSNGDTVRFGNTLYYNLTFTILNEGEQTGNSVIYRRKADTEYSYRYDIGRTFYGEDITVFGKSALRQTRSTGGVGAIITDPWKRRGETLEQTYSLTLLQEFLDIWNQPKKLLNLSSTDYLLPNETVPIGGKIHFATTHRVNCVTGGTEATYLDTTYVDTNADSDIDPELPPKDPTLPVRYSGRIDNTNDLGQIDRRFVTGSQTEVIDVNTSFFILQPNEGTYRVRLIFSNEIEQYTLTSIDTSNAKEGDQLTLLCISATEGQRAEQPQYVTISNNQNLRLPDNTAIVRRLRNAVFTFELNLFNNVGFWALLNESSIADPDPEEPIKPVTAPVIDPPSNYTTEQLPLLVTITTPDDDVDLTYSTDGSEPTTPYTGQFQLTNPGQYTIRARATRIDNTAVRAESVATYNLTVNIAEPYFNITPGTYELPVSVGISQPENTQVYYTLNGGLPDKNSTLYTAPILVNTFGLIQAVAYRQINGQDFYSSVISGTWTITGTVQPPVLEPPQLTPQPGTFTDQVNVVLLGEPPIYYTTDGSTPDITSNVWTETSAPIEVTQTTTIKAIRIKTGFLDSAVTEATYTIISTDPDIPPAPTLKPSQTFEDNFQVTIEPSGDPNRVPVRVYEIASDGSVPPDPTESSPLYTAPITITETTTVKARQSYEDADPDQLSSVAIATYTKDQTIVTYPIGISLMSVPLNCHLKESHLREIFQNKLVRGTVFKFDGSYRNVALNLGSPTPALNAEPGIGYWIQLTESVTVRWNEWINQPFNQLSNPAGIQNTGVQPPEEYELVYPDPLNQPSVDFYRYAGGIVAFRVIQTTPSASTVRIYLDDIITRNYTATETATLNFDIKTEGIAGTSNTPTVSAGFTTYNLSDKTEIDSSVTAIPVATAYTSQTVSRSVTSQVYLRPYIQIVTSGELTSIFELRLRNLFQSKTNLNLATSGIDHYKAPSSTSQITIGSLGRKSEFDFVPVAPIDEQAFYQFNDGTWKLADPEALEPGRGYSVLYPSGQTQYRIK